MSGTSAARHERNCSLARAYEEHLLLVVRDSDFPSVDKTVHTILGIACAYCFEVAVRVSIIFQPDVINISASGCLSKF